MAIFPADQRALAALAVLCVVSPLQAAAPRAAKPAVAEACADPIDIDAESQVLDLRAKRVTWSDPVIKQCTLRIQAGTLVADSAGTQTRQSVWEFSGAVRIAFGTGTLTADSATVHVVDGRITQAEARGMPAQFEQKLESLPRPVRGHAGTINFDIAAQTIRLSGDAYFNDGRNEMSYPTVVYDIKGQVAGNEKAPGSSDRVHMTIRPDQGGAEPVAPQPQGGRQ